MRIGGAVPLLDIKPRDTKPRLGHVSLPRLVLSVFAYILAHEAPAV